MAKGVKINKTYEKVIICGMGGSSIAGEILNFWQEITGMAPIFYIHRDYDLPVWASENDLAVCVSWSGNTEETLSCYETAMKSNIPVVSITTGLGVGSHTLAGNSVGKLEELSKNNKTPLVLIPDKNLKPIMGVGYMTGALFQLIGLGGNISSISLNSEKSEEFGKEMAEKIDENFPLLYSSYKWRIIPRLWKVLFNENAKVHAFWNYFPGMAHNELVGFTPQSGKVAAGQANNFYPIFFKDNDDDKRQNKNMDTAIAILKDLEYNYSIVDISNTETQLRMGPSPSSNKPLEAVLNSYILGLWTSFYLAKKIGVDPEETALLEEFKNMRIRL